MIISGPDLGELRRLGEETLAMVRKVPGATDSAIEQEADHAGLRIQIDRAKIARYGLNVEDVAGLIESGIGGRPISTLFEGERQFDIIARYRPEARMDTTDLGSMLVHTSDGGKVPMSQLADIQVVTGASIIARRENQRQITVRTNIRDRDQGGFVAESQARFEREIKLPPGIGSRGAGNSRTSPAHDDGYSSSSRRRSPSSLCSSSSHSVPPRMHP